jgi:hypothetical protein
LTKEHHLLKFNLDQAFLLRCLHLQLEGQPDLESQPPKLKLIFPEDILS